MDRFRFGRVVRALRQRRGRRQVDLADRATMSRSVVGRIERGELARIAWADLVRVADAVGARLEFDLRWQGEAIDRLLDERHAATADEVVRLLRVSGWAVEIEVSFSIFGERGSIDVVGMHPATGRVVVIEVKATVGDANQTIIGVDRKTRLMPEIAAKRRWTCRGVASLLVVAAGSTSRDRISRHRALFDAAFPSSAAVCRASLRDPTGPPPRGILFLDVRDVRRTGTTRARLRPRRVAEARPRSEEAAAHR